MTEHNDLIDRPWSAIVAVNAILALALFVVASNALAIAGLLTQISSTFAVRPADVAFTITAYAIIVATLAPLSPLLLARVARRTVLVGAMGTLLIGTIVAASAPDLGVFTLGRVISAIGGAALVPTALAAAVGHAPAERRGRAMAIAVSGFTLAGVVGAPAATALAVVLSWRGVLICFAGLGALVVAFMIALTGGLRTERPHSLATRLRALRNPRLLGVLVSIVASVTAGNAIYVYSGPVTGTGGRASELAALLFANGCAGLLGTFSGGWLTDRVGPRAVAASTAALQLAVYVALSLSPSFVLTLAVFAAWGYLGGAQQLAVQHRLATIDTRTTAVAIAWHSTALYLGLALAPILGAAAIAWGGTSFLPLASALVTVVAATLFQLTYLGPRDAEPHR